MPEGFGWNGLFRTGGPLTMDGLSGWKKGTLGQSWDEITTIVDLHPSLVLPRLAGDR
ncbi:MAG: hypothetical protein WAO02_14195 [Verrucomicrobiia bacterium]